MKSGSRIRIGFFLAALASPLAGLRAETLHVHLPTAPVSLDWNGSSTMIDAPMVLTIHEGLFRQGGVGEPLVPALAESFSREDEGRTYTFKIRKDAKWSDGRAVYAKDFADAWIRLIAPTSSSIYTYYLFDIENAREFNSGKVQDAAQVGIRAVDDHTLRVKLKRPSANWEQNTAFWPLFPVRKDLIEKYGSNWWRAGVLVSAGPFVWESYEPGKLAVLKRNPHHSVEGGSNVDRIEFQILSSHQEALKRYESGSFRFLWNLPAAVIPTVKDRASLVKQPLMRGHLLTLNAARYPMTNRDFRAAVLHSFDPEEIRPEQSDLLKPFPSLILPPLPGSAGNHRLPKDGKLARERLLKSRFMVSKQFKLRILTGISEPYMTIGKKLQARISEQLGIAVELDALPSQDYTTYMDLGEYHATLITWTAKVLSPQDFLLPYSGEAAHARVRYRNPFFDQYVFEGIRALNPTLAAKAFGQAQKLLCEDEAVISPLFQEKATHLVSKSVKNLRFNHMGLPLLDRVIIK
jgi:oligopeptide transport system substrate-binding protein